MGGCLSKDGAKEDEPDQTKAKSECDVTQIEVNIAATEKEEEAKRKEEQEQVKREEQEELAKRENEEIKQATRKKKEAEEEQKKTDTKKKNDEEQKKAEQEQKEIDDIKLPDALTLKRQTSVELIKTWTESYRNINNVMPEYRPAFQMSCVNRDLTTQSSTQHILEYLNDVIDKENIKLGAIDKFSKAVCKLISKTYADTKDPSQQTCLVTGRNILSSFKSIYSSIGWRQKYFHASLVLLERTLDASMGIVILSDICRASGTCIAGKKYGYSLVIGLIDPYKKEKDDKGDSGDEHNRSLVFEYLREFVADFALKAFNMSFIEPLLMHHRSAKVLQDCQLESHGINGITAVVNSALGIPIPIPCIEDFCPDCGVVEFLDVKHEPYQEAVKALLLPENFGKSYAAVKVFEPNDIPSQHIKYYGGPFIFNKKATARDMAMQAIDPSEENTERRKKLAPYLENFMQFFSKEFFVEKAMNALSANRSKVVQALFEDYLTQHPEIAGELDEDAAEDYRCWVWDIMTGTFHLERAHSLLQFAGICQ